MGDMQIEEPILLGLLLLYKIKCHIIELHVDRHHLYKILILLGENICDNFIDIQYNDLSNNIVLGLLSTSFLVHLHIQTSFEQVIERDLRLLCREIIVIGGVVMGV